jgi:hypothetical protein
MADLALPGGAVSNEPRPECRQTLKHQPMWLAKAAAVITPADQASQKLDAPFSVHRRQRGGRSVLQVSRSVSAMEALRARIRAQSKTVAEHIAADPYTNSFLGNWATPEPFGR